MYFDVVSPYHSSREVIAENFNIQDVMCERVILRSEVWVTCQRKIKMLSVVLFVFDSI